MWTTYGSFLLLILTLAFVVWRPRNLSIGWSAMVGGAIALLFGFVHFYDLISIISLVWNATLTLVAIFIISMVLQDLGFFDWAALWIVKLSRGNGNVYFLYVVLLGALISAFFTNEGTALILTPIILAKMRLMKFDERWILPLVMAAGFIADTTSLPLVTSNLVNILSADFFEIGYAAYAAKMILPNVVSLIVSFLLLFLLYRRSIPKTFSLEGMAEPSEQIQDPFLFRCSWILLFLLFAFCFVNQFLFIPLSLIFWICALIFLGLSKVRDRVHVTHVLREAPWEIVFFSLGMYVVVYGVRNSMGFSWIEDGLLFLSERGLYASIIGMGFMSAILSSIFNNLPAMMLNLLAIDGLSIHETIRQGLIYANIIGCDIGPKMTPIGSLSTLLWLYLLGKRDIHISWGYYCKVGILLTIPTLFLTLLFFWFQTYVNLSS